MKFLNNIEKAERLTTNILGLLKGANGKVAQAVAGTDYATPDGVSSAVSNHDSASGAHSTQLGAKLDKSGGTLEDYAEKLVALSGTTPTINLADGSVFTHTLTGNTAYSITGAASGKAHSFTLVITQTSTVRTITFPSSVKWQDGEIPDMSTASASYAITFLTVDSGTNWLAMFGGVF